MWSCTSNATLARIVVIRLVPAVTGKAELPVRGVAGGARFIAPNAAGQAICIRRKEVALAICAAPAGIFPARSVIAVD